MPQLSIIILSYNTKGVTKQCLDGLIKCFEEQKSVTGEIIVVDNASHDGSVEMLKQYQQSQLPLSISLELILNKKNVGYPKGNNQGIQKAKGEFILLLNSDAIIQKIDFQELFEYLRSHKDVGALTVRLILPNGTIDPASHRGFPTIWNSFCYFTGLEKILGPIFFIGKFFGGYHLTHKNLNTMHEIDSPTGAFYLSPAEVMRQVGGFDDKNFFLYGEDLDLSYRIKEKGYKIIYYPKFLVLHLKHTSGLKKKNSSVQNQSKEYFYKAMKIFYKKHYEKIHSQFINTLVYFAIDFKKKIS